MPKLIWDQVGKRFYETGVDRGVLYLPNEAGKYLKGVAWNGLTAVNQQPEGGEDNPQYADNIEYLNLVSAEKFKATIEAFTYPVEFEECDGSRRIAKGITIGQQTRKPFGFSYRTIVGNDTLGNDLGYKIHLVYGAKAAPSEKSYNTVNDSPEAITFSWSVSGSPVAVPGFRPTAIISIDSRTTSTAGMKAIEEALYGSDQKEPNLPLPEDNLAMLATTGDLLDVG